MKLTIVHPCIGRIPGKEYVRSWQMEPLPAAHLAGLTPDDVEIAFWDDRMEDIPYDEPTDLVAISVETYTARRAYEIASEFRRRGVPVVMGGFHATLMPHEVQQYAESVVVGEAEAVWQQVIDDARNHRLQPRYRAQGRPDIACVRPDRSIFEGKRYLSIGLIEAGRGCNFRCEFCAVQTVFGATQTRRSVETIVEEIRELRGRRKLFFFVDDNMVAHPESAKRLFRALIPLKIKWVSQATVTMAEDEEMLELMKASGCQGVLIGFESLHESNLALMNKSFNTARMGPREAVRRLHAKGIRLYATFVFGYDHDTLEDFERTRRFCEDEGIFMVAFNHLTPFPGTPLYARLEREGRLLYDKWWLDERYRYGQVPFRTTLDAGLISERCVEMRKKFYGPWSILRRARNRANISNWTMFHSYFFINALLRKEAAQRENYPLGDLSYSGPLLQVEEGASVAVSA